MSKTPALIVTILVSVTWLRAQGQRKETAQMNSPESNHAIGESQREAHPRKHAEAKITVHSSDAKPYDQTESPALSELHLSETFTGEIDGESSVRAFQTQHGDHSSSLVSMQRFSGKLAGRKGTFVLQGQETVANGNIKATWFVVPGSGTGDLTGLRGTGGFEGQFGKGSTATLDYWFE